jgi:hypothetical protein
MIDRFDANRHRDSLWHQTACEIKKNCEICGTIDESSRKIFCFIPHREKLFADVKSACEHSSHSFPF